LIDCTNASEIAPEGMRADFYEFHPALALSHSLGQHTNVTLF